MTSDRIYGKSAFASFVQVAFLTVLVAALVACGGAQDNSGDGVVNDSVLAGESVLNTRNKLAKSAELNTRELARAHAGAQQTAAPPAQVVTKAAARAPVFRFYNGQTGAHFYTISVEERDRVQNTLPVYRYEGEAFFVSPVAEVGLSPVYRFFNTQTGVHFYSISADEKAHIEANLPQFNYEGVGYYASKTALADMVPLYRFYVSTQGFHFYSASEAEKDRIRAQLPHYQFENVGYYVYGSGVESVPVGGTLSGLIAGNPVVLTLNGGGDLTLSGNGVFTFSSRTPLGAIYVVGMKTQPRGQTCTLSNATGTAIAAVSNVSVTCVNNAPSDLLISEVGGCPWQGFSGCWLEVYNPTATTRNLSNYQLRSGDSASTVGSFALPNVSISPGQYRILASNVAGDVPLTGLNPVVMLGNAGSSPFWGGLRLSGLVELVSAGTGATVDAVRFGSATSAPAPITSAQWVGAPVVAGFVGDITDQTRSIVRPQATMSSQDTQSALDWVAVDYPTPGGPNDVAPGSTDADNDGLPDDNEQPGASYNGLDLYSMGARAGQRDIFVEVDHMNSTKAGVLPNQAAMQMVKNAFALRGFAVHIDVGNRFSAGFDPAQFNLGQGSPVVPYEACLGWAATDCAGNTSTNYRTVYDWKWQHFDPRRRAVFHYALFGDGASTPSWGRAELFGNDFVVTMSSITGVSEWTINQQANTFMHELGHNLGLRHGGHEETNYKPNYLSVMNYLMDGVTPGNSVWPFWEWQWRFGSSPGGYTCVPGSTYPVCTADPAPFVIDFSDGSSLPLNENALHESANVGRGALPGVYADWDESRSLTSTPVTRDLNGDGVMGVLTDHNDWAALTLPFVRQWSGGLLQKSGQHIMARKAAKVPESGATVPNPLFGDRGPTVVVCGDPRGTEILNKLRTKAAKDRSPLLLGR